MTQCCNHNCRQGRDCPLRRPLRPPRRLGWQWALRMLRALPAALERLHLQWALREIDPMHPDVQYIINRLRDIP